MCAGARKRGRETLPISAFLALRFLEFKEDGIGPDSTGNSRTIVGQDSRRRDGRKKSNGIDLFVSNRCRRNTENL